MACRVLVGLLQQLQRQIPGALVVPLAVLVVYRERFGRVLPQRSEQRASTPIAGVLHLHQTPPAVGRVGIPPIAAEAQTEAVDGFRSNIDGSGRFIRRFPEGVERAIDASSA